jgi:hypothetical protein
VEMLSLEAPFVEVAISGDITSGGFICGRSHFWSPICIAITGERVTYGPELSA